MNTGLYENDGSPGSVPREKDFSDQIINGSRSMISVINRNYVYEKVNSAFCNAQNTPDESVLGKTLSDIWGEEIFNNILRKNIDKCFGGDVVRYEASFTTPKHGKRHFEVIFRPVPARSGEVTHIVAETSDINELIQTRLQARKREEELRNFEKNLPIGFMRCDSEGRILHVNKAFLKLIECDDEVKLPEMNVRDLYIEEGLFSIHYQQVVDCHSKFFGNIELRSLKGNNIQCRVSGYIGANEVCSGYADFVFEDTSRELMLENRLMQAQKLETIGSLAGGIAHDFNNILATVSGYSEMLREDLPAGSEPSEKVKKIQAAVVRGKSIISQILTFSRQVDQEKIRVNADEVLKETIGFMRSSIPANIIVKSSISDKPLSVLADPTQLFRVFLNLMTNAVQSMEKGGGSLTVKLEAVEGEMVRYKFRRDIVADEYALVTFSDTGEGMDPRHMNRIFEPFFTTRDVGQGTGLGLSVVHGIITEMEGEILVSSQWQKGSSFYVYLPVSKEYPGLPESFEKKRKVLFITGNRHESRILSIALENKGYRLIYVTDRKNLAPVLDDCNDQPDLMIYMSDSEQIHQDDLLRIMGKSGSSVPCIIITDPEREILAENLVNSGIVKQHLFKPVSLKELTGAIGFLLKDL